MTYFIYQLDILSIMLYIVSTPIGNMDDITYRAVHTLRDSDFIVCEDTRTTGKLLRHFEIPKKKLMSYNDYNSQKRIPEILSHLKEGLSGSIVSENGTPAVSDPGYKLIQACIEEDIKVVPIPGPTAFVTGLVGSGLPTDSFSFFGFLPKSKKKKEDLFKGSIGRTAIFYESPHRIVKTLKALADIQPDRDVCVARELTKRFEEFTRGTATEVLENFKERPKIKGEIVLLLGK